MTAHMVMLSNERQCQLEQEGKGERPTESQKLLRAFVLACCLSLHEG